MESNATSVRSGIIHPVSNIADHLRSSAPFFELGHNGHMALARREQDQGTVGAFFDFIEKLSHEGYGPLLSAVMVEQSKGTARGPLTEKKYRVFDPDGERLFAELTIEVVRDGREFYTASVSVGRGNVPEGQFCARSAEDTRLARNLYERFF